MPKGVVKTERDERLWDKAKGIAEKAGRGGDYAYVMGVYKKMKGGSLSKSTANPYVQHVSTVTPAWRRVPGAASMLKNRKRESLSAQDRYLLNLYTPAGMPKPATRENDGNYTTPSEVVKYLGFSPQAEQDLATKVGQWVNAARIETDLRKALHANLRSLEVPRDLAAEIGRRCLVLFRNQRRGQGDFMVKSIWDGVSEDEARALAQRLGVDLKRIPLEQFRQGIAHEREHRGVTEANDVKTAQIALDHLKEDPRYYSKLERMEKAMTSVFIPLDLVKATNIQGRQSTVGKPANGNGKPEPNGSPNLDADSIENGPQDPEHVQARLAELHRDLHELHQHLDSDADIHMHNEIVAQMRKVHKNPTPEGLDAIEHMVEAFTTLAQGPQEEGEEGPEEKPQAKPNGPPGAMKKSLVIPSDLMGGNGYPFDPARRVLEGLTKASGRTHPVGYVSTHKDGSKHKKTAPGKWVQIKGPTKGKKKGGGEQLSLFGGDPHQAVQKEANKHHEEKRKEDRHQESLEDLRAQHHQAMQDAHAAIKNKDHDARAEAAARMKALKAKIDAHTAKGKPASPKEALLQKLKDLGFSAKELADVQGQSVASLATMAETMERDQAEQAEHARAQESSKAYQARMRKEQKEAEKKMKAENAARREMKYRDALDSAKTFAREAWQGKTIIQHTTAEAAYLKAAKYAPDEDKERQLNREALRHRHEYKAMKREKEKAEAAAIQVKVKAESMRVGARDAAYEVEDMKAGTVEEKRAKAKAAIHAAMDHDRAAEAEGASKMTQRQYPAIAEKLRQMARDLRAEAKTQSREAAQKKSAERSKERSKEWRAKQKAKKEAEEAPQGEAARAKARAEKRRAERKRKRQLPKVEGPMRSLLETIASKGGKLAHGLTIGRWDERVQVEATKMGLLEAKAGTHLTLTDLGKEVVNNFDTMPESEGGSAQATESWAMKMADWAERKKTPEAYLEAAKAFESWAGKEDHAPSRKDAMDKAKHQRKKAVAAGAPKSELKSPTPKKATRKKKEPKRKEGESKQRHWAYGEHIEASAKDKRSAADLVMEGRIGDLSNAEAAAVVNKKSLMPVFDAGTYQAMGASPGASHLALQLSALVGAKPPAKTRKAREDYARGIRLVAGAMPNFRTVDDVQNFVKDLHGQLQDEAAEDKVMQSWALGFSPAQHKQKMAEAVQWVKDNADKSDPNLNYVILAGYRAGSYGLRIVQQRAPLRNAVAALGSRFGQQLGIGKVEKVKASDGDAFGGTGAVTHFNPARYYRTHGGGKIWKDARRLAAYAEGKERDNAGAGWEEINDRMAAKSEARKGNAQSTKPRFKWKPSISETPDLKGTKNEVKKGDRDRLGKTFNFKGLQRGESIPDKDLDHHLRHAEMAFHDLADVLGIDPEDISLQGRLSLAFGARGKAGARAHYEPDSKAINLTRFAGAGSVAHEWGHFMDNILAETQGLGDNSFATKSPSRMQGEVGDAIREVMDAMTKTNDPSGASTKRSKALEAIKEDISSSAKEYNDASIARSKLVREAFDATDDRKAELDKEIVSAGVLVEDLRLKHNAHVAQHNMIAKMPKDASDYHIDALIHDKGKAGKYTSKPVEMFARAFETFVQDKLEDNGRRNSYLCDGTRVEYGKPYWHSKHLDTPSQRYPQGDERKRINAAMENLMKVLAKGGHLKKAMEYALDLLKAATDNMTHAA